jgi:DHA2 family multidrug resistance protein
LFLQKALGYTPRQAGHVFLPMGVMLSIGAITSGRLTDRIGGKIPAILGVLLITYCFYRYNSLSLNTKTGYILTNIVILGLGMGLFMAPTQTTAISSMPREKIAQASGLINVIRQIGGSFGVAGLSTLLIHKTTLNFAELSQLTNPYSPGFKTVLTQLFYYALRTTGDTAAMAVKRGQYLIVSQIEKQAYVSAIDGVYLFAMIVLALSLVPIIMLRHNRRRPDAVKQARRTGTR